MSEKFNEMEAQNETALDIQANEVRGSSALDASENIEASDSPEQIVSPEEGQRIHEDDEGRGVAATLAQRLNETEGTNYTAEDLITAPESMSLVTQLLDRHPRARKMLNVFMLGTALAGAAGAPEEAEAADPFTQAAVRTVTQGYIQQRNMSAQQQIYQEQAMNRHILQKQQAQMRSEQAHRDLIARQQMQQEDLAHRHAMKSIKDPFEREKAELDYRQQKERRLEVINRQRQEENFRIQMQSQEAQMRSQQIYQQEQAARNIENQVIQQGANRFLQEILMPRRR